MLRSTHCHRMCGSLLLLCLLAGPGPVAGGESLGSTTYDLSAVRSAVQRVLVEARAEMARAKPLPGAAPPPPLTMQLGFVSDSGEVTVEVGTDSRTGRNISVNDTFLYGSGTKSFIAARIFQLIEAGKLDLTSNVAEQIDPLLHAMNGTSMVQLFGPPASAITVGELLRMASGLGVMDSDPFDALTWTQSRADHRRVFPPMEFLHATRCEHFDHNASNCASFAMDCQPGPCRQYSSVNFEVLGLVLLLHDVPACANASLARSREDTHPSDGSCSWQNLSVRTVFGRSPPGRYPITQFYNAEPLKKWLTVTGWDSPNSDGNKHNYTSVWEENGSVLGWTCGNMVAPAIEVARFFYDLLSPHAPEAQRILHADNVAVMTKFQHFNRGWDRGNPKLQYGAGLMRLEPCNCDHKIVANGACYYQGHGGNTYGFVTMNGFFPALNASIALAMNARNVGALDSLQCKLINAIYPLSSYHPPQTEIWEQIGWASLIVACLVCLLCFCGHGCKDPASFCEDCCSLSNDIDSRSAGLLYEPINR